MSKPLKWVKEQKGWYTCQATENISLRIMKLRNGQGWSIYIHTDSFNGMVGYYGLERLIPDMHTHRAKAECIEFAKRSFGEWT